MQRKKNIILTRIIITVIIITYKSRNINEINIYSPNNCGNGLHREFCIPNNCFTFAI